MTLRNMVLKRLDRLNEEMRELKIKNEMLFDSLKNDEELCELEQKMKDATLRYKAHKMALLNEPEAAKIVADAYECKLEIKQLKEILSGELLGLFKETESLEFKDEEGEIYRISFSGKVKRSDQPSLFDSTVEDTLNREE